MDRLIAVEPTWQNYRWRAGVSDRSHSDRVRDILEAGRRAGKGYWHQHNSADRFLKSASNLIDSATRTPEEYHLGLQLAEAFSSAIPEDWGGRLLFAKALYRVGRYTEVLSLLDGWQREWQRAIFSQVGQVFMTRWPVALLRPKPVEADFAQALVFLAMTHHRLGHREHARALLADLPPPRIFENPGNMGGPYRSIAEIYADLLREAEGLIEGRPQPGK